MSNDYREGYAAGYKDGKTVGLKDGKEAWKKEIMNSSTTLLPAPPDNTVSLRDQFAIGAMQGHVTYHSVNNCDLEKIANLCYRLADAMLVERAKGVKNNG